MARRSLLGFLTLNVVVTLLVAAAVILISDRLRGVQPTPPKAPPLQVIVTATPDPNQKLQVVTVVVTVLVTPPRVAGGPTIPSNAAFSTAIPTGTAGVSTPSSEIPPTLDPSLLPSTLGPLDVPTATPTDPSGCPTYIIKAGDFPGKIASDFKVSVDDLMRANKMKPGDEKRLQIGQKLIIPVNGCGIPPTDVPTETPTIRVLTATTAPSVTLAPTASTTKIEVVQVFNKGDIKLEGIELRNISGDVLNTNGWTMKDKKGNVFKFPEALIFDRQSVVVFTRKGDKTPIVFFWGLNQAIWNDPTQEITIADAKGVVILRYSIPSGDGSPTPGGTPIPLQPGVVSTPTPGN